MQLTRFSEYALRVIMYVALHDDGPVTTGDIADSFGISESHLRQVTRALAGLGVIATTRGKGGGLRLARPPDQINLGEVVRFTEADLTVVDSTNPICPLTGICDLKGVLDEAVLAFLSVLDSHTIADLLTNRRTLLRRFA